MVIFFLNKTKPPLGLGKISKLTGQKFVLNLRVQKTFHDVLFRLV